MPRQGGRRMLETRTALGLAEVIAMLRPDWQTTHVKRVLYDARDKGTQGEVVLAALYAALSPANRSPEVVPMDGPHWRAARAHLGTPGGTGSPKRGAACQVCGLDQSTCEARWSTDHEFESIDDARKRRARSSS